MADDKAERGPKDRSRINIHEDYEVRYWTGKWSISPTSLAAAVAKVGVIAKDVAKELGRKA